MLHFPPQAAGVLHEFIFAINPQKITPPPALKKKGKAGEWQKGINKCEKIFLLCVAENLEKCM